MHWSSMLEKAHTYTYCGRPLSCMQHWTISVWNNITSTDITHTGKQESHENKYQSLILYPLLTQIWMTAKEKAEASVGLLYVKVPHRKIMCADMRVCCTRDGLGRGHYREEENTWLSESHWNIPMPTLVQGSFLLQHNFTEGHIVFFHHNTKYTVF